MKLVFRRNSMEYYQSNRNIHFVTDEMASVKIWHYSLILLIAFSVSVYIFYTAIPQTDTRTLICEDNQEVIIKYLVRGSSVMLMRKDESVIEVAYSEFNDASNKQWCSWGSN